MQREAALREHVEHPVVLRHDLCLEYLEAVVARQLRDARDHHSPEAVALHVVGHGKGGFDRIWLRARVHRVTDDAAVVVLGDQAHTVVPVDLDHVVRRPPGIHAGTEKAERK